MSKKDDPNDIGWKHGYSDTKHGTVCKYCGKHMAGGGITRLKGHLMGGMKDVAICRDCPPDVRRELKKDKERKDLMALEKKKMQANIRSKTKQFGRHQAERSESEEDEAQAEGGGSSDSDSDCPSDVMSQRERREYRRAMRASRADQWERDQSGRAQHAPPHFRESHHESGGCSSGKKKG